MGTGEGAEVIAAANASELESLRYEKESQGKELLILRRTVDELEIRIETQKQTLAARDASIKTLLDMLQVRDWDITIYGCLFSLHCNGID